MTTDSKCAESAKIPAVDISSEEYRIYTYANGQKLRINEPLLLFVLPGNSHRITDAEGLTHRPTPGFLDIAWKPRVGEPAFVA